MKSLLAIAAFAVLAISFSGCNEAEYNTNPELGSSDAKATSEAGSPEGSPKGASLGQEPSGESQANAAAPNQPNSGSANQRSNSRQPGQGGDRSGGPQGFGGGMAGGGASLALREDVRKELGLTDKQVESLRTKLRELMPQPGPNGDRPQVNPEEIAKKTEAAIKSVLTPAQQKRLQELQLQRTGPSALADKTIAAKVGISEETRAKIEKMVQDHRQKVRQQFSSQPSSQEEAQKRQEEMRKSREKLQADILALLTPDQKAKWESLLGKPFEFQQRRGGGAGGGTLMTPRT